MKKQLLQDALHDLAFICTIGIVLDAALFVVLFVVLWFVAAMVVMTALTYMRNVLLVVGALVLFISAGLILFGRKIDLHSNEKWTKYFHLVGLFPVVLGVAIFILALAVTMDYLVFVPI